MDAQDSSTDAVEVEASGRRKDAAAVRARAVDYQPIINDTVAGLAPNAAERHKIYAHARLVVARGLTCMGLAEAAIEVEKLALDLAIERVEQGWRAKAAEQAIPAAARLSGSLAVRGFRPPLAIGWWRLQSLRRVAETLVYAVSPEGGIRSGVVRGGEEARPHATPDPFPQPRGALVARSRLGPAPVRTTRINVPPAIAIASIAVRLPRGLAETASVAVALCVIAAMLFLVLHVDGIVTYRSAGGDPGHSLYNPRSGPGVRTAAANNVSSHRGHSRAAPTHAALQAAHDAPAPSRVSEGATGEGDVACGRGPSMSPINCPRDIAGGSAAAQVPKTPAKPPSQLESYSPFSDMTWGFGPSNALRGPTVSVEDFLVGGVMAYAPPAADAAPASPAAPRAAAPQAPQRPAKPINPKIVGLIASGKQAALRGNLDRAVRDFNEAVRIGPKYPDGYLARGQTYFKLGETERAIADYSAALALDPQHAAALRARGMAHLYLGKNDLALSDLSKAIELGEKDPQLLAPIESFYARRSRAAIYDSEQQYDEEIADCTALIESSTHDPVLAEALAADYGTAGTANAVAKLYRQRANALARTSNIERAMADLTAAIRLSSDRGYAALLDRAKLHELVGRRDLAVADTRAALKIRPSSEEARLALSRLNGLAKPTPPNEL
jgi:regulator of sirC expression with transglutaminase-like and TPR domain